jgi:hypothetical protein
MPDPYGTVMIGRLRAPVEDAEELVKKWVDERRVPGFRCEDILIGDDGVTVVMAVQFEDEASYQALADDPMQDEWWSNRMAPLLDGDPQWIDGHWRMHVAA